MFQQALFVKKEENRQFFQYTHFTRKFPQIVLRLKLEIVNTVNFTRKLQMYVGQGT